MAGTTDAASVTAADVVAALEALRRQTPTVVTLSPGYDW